MTKKEHNDRMNMKKPRRRSPPGSSSWWENILQYDRQWTQRWGVCATKESTSGRLRPVMKGLEISGHGLPWFTILLAILYQSYLSKNSVVFNPTANLVLGMLLDLLVSFILKGTVRRPRPALNKPDMLLTVSVDNYSFPSGHCTRAGFVFYFFVTTFTLPLLMQFLLLLWMSAVCISRVLLGRHYWSDVICGTIIGLLQGLFIQRNWKTWDLTEDL
ncbi:phospholipid phosphatase 6 [Strongylocentrotus purpuratus]|uniref:Phosphatidic acid phosphatase type 2/haloperoxidase domain-containing protein n=1 Tax=Strongylocentrotus purpuratus TaxID=7668 RepID=A0A7M7T4R8_STRPU|nr:phospholipid phosphatase 6 [Strongylocentrotus purpuratus]